MYVVIPILFQFVIQNELKVWIKDWSGYGTFCTRVYIHLGTLHSSINHFFKFKLTLARFYKVTVITYSANDLLFCYTLYKCSFQWFLHGNKFFLMQYKLTESIWLFKYFKCRVCRLGKSVGSLFLAVPFHFSTSTC